MHRCDFTVISPVCGALAHVRWLGWFMGKMMLEGEVVKLKKPLAIMSLVKEDDGAKTEYHAAGVVRQKLVFKTRPVPVGR